MLSELCSVLYVGSIDQHNIHDVPGCKVAIYSQRFTRCLSNIKEKKENIMQWAERAATAVALLKEHSSGATVEVFTHSPPVL